MYLSNQKVGALLILVFFFCFLSMDFVNLYMHLNPVLPLPYLYFASLIRALLCTSSTTIIGTMVKFYFCQFHKVDKNW